jgi:hypothetical protein
MILAATKEDELEVVSVEIGKGAQVSWKNIV